MSTRHNGIKIKDLLVIGDGTNWSLLNGGWSDGSEGELIPPSTHRWPPSSSRQGRDPA